MGAGHLALLGVGVVVVAGGLTAAVVSRDRGRPAEPVSLSQNKDTPAESDATGLPRAVAARVGAMAAPVARGRNLFQFGSGRGATRIPARGTGPPPEDADAPQPVARPPVDLIGVANDPAAGGSGTPVAVLVVGGELVLASVGQPVPPRYRVVGIEGGSVEIEDSLDGARLRLTLK